MATMLTILMNARRTAITVRITLLAACSSGSVPGIADTTGAATMAVRDTDTMGAAIMAGQDMATTDAATTAGQDQDMGPGQDIAVVIAATQVVIEGAPQVVVIEGATEVAMHAEVGDPTAAVAATGAATGKLVRWSDLRSPTKLAVVGVTLSE
jgi:hypothetical protein